MRLHVISWLLAAPGSCNTPQNHLLTFIPHQKIETEKLTFLQSMIFFLKESLDAISISLIELVNKGVH